MPTLHPLDGTEYRFATAIAYILDNGGVGDGAIFFDYDGNNNFAGGVMLYCLTGIAYRLREIAIHGSLASWIGGWLHVAILSSIYPLGRRRGGLIDLSYCWFGKEEGDQQ